MASKDTHIPPAATDDTLTPDGADTLSAHRSNLHRTPQEERIRQLEEQSRFTLDILEMASALGDFQTSINQLSDPSALLDEAVERINELVQFSATAFYLVDENTSDFVPAYCNPQTFLPYLEPELDTLIDNGLFALALRDNRPIIIYSRDNKYRLVLHVLATASRTRGMFIGVMPREDKNLSGILLSLLSIVLKHCANAIESFELYRLFHKNSATVQQQLNATPIPVMDCLADGTILTANTAMTKLLGIGESALKSISLDAIFTDEGHTKLQESFTLAEPEAFTATLHLAGNQQLVLCNICNMSAQPCPAICTANPTGADSTSSAPPDADSVSTGAGAKSSKYSNVQNHTTGTSLLLEKEKAQSTFRIVLSPYK